MNYSRKKRSINALYVTHYGKELTRLRKKIFQFIVQDERVVYGGDG